MASFPRITIGSPAASGPGIGGPQEPTHCPGWGPELSLPSIWLSVPRPHPLPPPNPPTAFLLKFPLHSKLQGMKWRLWRQNAEAKVLRGGLNPDGLAWPPPCSSAHEEVDCSNLQAQLLLLWAAEATATGHQAVRHPSWGHALGPAPGLGCPAEHLSFTHFIKHLLHDALPASLLSKNKHRSPQGRGINHQGWQKHHEPGSPLPSSQPHQVSSDTFRVGWAVCMRA